MVVAGALSGEDMGVGRAMIRGVTVAAGQVGIMSRLETSFAGEPRGDGQGGRDVGTLLWRAGAGDASQ